MISPSFIKDLLDKVDIFDVINRRVQLQVKGENGWACCPFHNEKTSSFSVSRNKQFFHCFGCGESGNAIGFIMKYEGLEFQDAVEKLAQEAGLQVRYEGGGKKRNPEAPRLTELMKQAQDFYVGKLRQNEAAMHYIVDRGLTQETIAKFGLGYSPDGWRNLSECFPKSQNKYLIQCGLLREGKNGNEPYDFFRNRLMFPIRNVRGQTIAFSARTMIGEEPKYINTGETPIFIKGHEVFGLYEALTAIRSKGRVIVVEGQMDVIQLSQAGFQEACAPLGTAIKSEHIEKLLKMTDHIIFSFDGDKAGHKAARRALELSLPLLGDTQKASFVFLPDGEDPDSYVKAHGAQAFEEFLKKALPLSKYLIENLSSGLDLDLAEDKSRFLAEVTPLVKSVRSSVFRNALLMQLGTVVKMEEVSDVAGQIGFKVEEPTPPPSYYPNRFNRNYGHWNRPPQGTVFNAPIRRVAPGEGEQLLVLVRNFVRFPQLIMMFEGAATEYITQLNHPYAKAVIELVAVVFRENEDGFSLQDVIAEIPDVTAEDYHQKLDYARSLLQTLLGSSKQVNLYAEQFRKGVQLRTSYLAAQLETQKIFVHFELEKVEEEKRRLMAQGVKTDEDRENYLKLSRSHTELKLKKKELIEGSRSVEPEKQTLI